MEDSKFGMHRNQSNIIPIQSFFAFCPSQKAYNSATHLNMNSSQHPDFPLHLFSPNASSSLSTEDEGREYEPNIVDDKRLRRMISNRESARRSRMRKKQQIEELQSQVDQLQTINRQLSQKLINLLATNHEILQDNTQLKEKVSTLHMLLADVFTPLRNPQDNSLKQKSAS